GTATLDLLEPVEAEATIDADNNELVFVFILGSLNEQSTGIKLNIAPNPVSSQSKINIISEHNEKISIWLINLTGQHVIQPQVINLQQGNNSLLLSDFISSDQLQNGIYLFQLKGKSSYGQLKFLINN
ncbi:MAG: T9SS type A sorting domain-containing protein, partial [Bacteroidales bacterium]|nr:T9SS type A sorting domain-containing protein [Bacteroidales bacterium]